MKGRSLILIFLFFVVVVHPVYAETGSFHWMGSDVGTSPSFLQSGSFSYHSFTDNSLYFTDQQTLESFQSVTSNLSGSEFGYSGSGDVNSGHDNSVTIMSGTQVVGTGIFGYYKMADGRYNVYFYHWQDWNITGLTAPIRLTITDSDIGVNVGRTYAVLSPTPYSDGDCVIEFRNNVYKPVGLSGLFNTYSSYNYYNRYEYNSYVNFNELNFIRDSFNKSKIIIEIDGSEVKNETSLIDTDLSWVDGFDVWNITMENIFGDNDSRQIVFETVLPEHSAVIDFNQSFYNSPELVGVEYDIQNLDIVNYEYWILVTGTNSGTEYIVSNEYYDITTATGQDNFSISYSPLILPFTMQAELWTYSKVSGESFVLAYSPKVAYNPASLAPGSIWTEKSNYNISEMFYIEFDTNYNTIQIELISSTFHDLRTMEGPGLGHLGYMFNTPHNFTAYLIENGIRTNHTDFTVSADNPFLNIYLDSIPLKQIFSLEYFTDNTSDTITGYRPDGSIFYGPVTNLQINEKTDLSGLQSSSPPGLYTLSLLHDGTEYYNDSITMISKNEYVYFEANKYETGDTIIIYSYVTDSRQQVRLSDSSGQAVITWTSANEYIIPNAPTVLYFSLIDNNEYGQDIETSLDSGSIRAGNWKVEIVDTDGKPLTNESTYDFTTVSIRIDEPADASNEIIKTFFSLEGLFLIFTVCLTMMGLAVAKHPAGGGAGAVVGVGFGVYFGALPVWMLLLMVITLVVLAGVSVAVYFRGK